MQTKRLFYVVALGMGLTLALLMVLNSSPLTIYAASADWFVKVGGAGTCAQNNPCALGTALTQAQVDDSIYMAQGTYTGTGTAVISITKSITIYGGWDGAASGTVVRDSTTYPTILDGENGRRVVYITGTIAPILDGLTLQRGDAAGLGGDPTMPTTDFGGAVYANNASPVITNCRIVSSTAGFGGGLALFYGTPTVANSVVLSNTASQDIGGGTIRGGGGGIFLYQSPATIANNIVSTNVASGTHLTFDGGGGLYLDTSAALILSNTIRGNYGTPNAGGIYLWQSTAVIRENLIQDNNAGSNVGGGVVVGLSMASLESNMILDNDSPSIGGGVFVSGSPNFTLTNNIFAWNSADGYAPAIFIAEYQPLVGPGQPCQGTLLHNTFAENNSPAPWMIHIGGTSGCPYPTTVALTNTLIEKPGGIYVDAAGSVALDTTLWDPSLLLLPGLTISGTGTVISRTNYYSVPHFVGLFHLAPGSPGVDLGTNAWVTTDVDGDPRPIGPASDIGADEARLQVFLPLVLR
jgi:hypothetical protein